MPHVRRTTVNHMFQVTICLGPDTIVSMLTPSLFMVRVVDPLHLQHNANDHIVKKAIDDDSQVSDRKHISHNSIGTKQKHLNNNSNALIGCLKIRVLIRLIYYFLVAWIPSAGHNNLS